MTGEQASLILEILRQMRAELATRADPAFFGSAVGVIKSDTGALRSDAGSPRAALAADFRETRKDLSEQIEGLRQTVIDCHTMALRFCPSLRRLGAPVAALADGGLGP
jgi:hypothetical protein